MRAVPARGACGYGKFAMLGTWPHCATNRVSGVGENRGEVVSGALSIMYWKVRGHFDFNVTVCVDFGIVMVLLGSLCRRSTSAAVEAAAHDGYYYYYGIVIGAALESCCCWSRPTDYVAFFNNNLLTLLPF